MIVNSREYPLWSQFVERKAEWIGGILEDAGDDLDRALGLLEEGVGRTEIYDITLKPNGTDSAYFTVHGKDFSCGGDCGKPAPLGIVGGEDGWITFSGYGGHRWRIKRKGESSEKAR